MNRNLMNLLPFERITYKTKLDPQEVIQRMSDIIEPQKPIRMPRVFGGKDHKAYEGSVDEMSFNIRRVIRYRNSFLPRIKGVIEKDPEGTRIHVKMRLHVWVIIFMLVWFVGVGIACLAVLASFLNEEEFSPLALIPFGMFVFGYALIMGGFKYESIKSKKYFSKFFEEEAENRQ